MEQWQGLCYNITCGVRVSLCWFIVYLVAVFAGNKGGYFLFGFPYITTSLAASS